MIKKIFILLLFYQLGVAQDLLQDSETGKYISEKVIQVDSVSREYLFSRAMEWVALSYKSAQDVIQHSDKERGKIICKGNFSTNLFMKSGWIRHTLTLEFKEGRFRQTYSDFSYYSSGSGELPFESKNLGFKNKILNETSNKINSSTESLKEYLQTNKKNDDW